MLEMVSKHEENSGLSIYSARQINLIADTIIYDDLESLKYPIDEEVASLKCQHNMTIDRVQEKLTNYFNEFLSDWRSQVELELEYRKNNTL